MTFEKRLLLIVNPVAGRKGIQKMIPQIIRIFMDASYLVTTMVTSEKDEGKEFDVLIEGFSKRSREQLMGRTEQNKAVVMPKAGHHVGETVRVKITGSTSATLLGEIV